MAVRQWNLGHDFTETPKAEQLVPVISCVRCPVEIASIDGIDRLLY
ncbi:MAG: hypothetical protein ACR2QF_06660 [Geminicoccaceae bacterium]